MSSRMTRTETCGASEIDQTVIRIKGEMIGAMEAADINYRGKTKLVNASLAALPYDRTISEHRVIVCCLFEVG